MNAISTKTIESKKKTWVVIGGIALAAICIIFWVVAAVTSGWVTTMVSNEPSIFSPMTQWRETAERLGNSGDLAFVHSERFVLFPYPRHEVVLDERVCGHPAAIKRLAEVIYSSPYRIYLKLSQNATCTLDSKYNHASWSAI